MTVEVSESSDAVIAVVCAVSTAVVGFSGPISAVVLASPLLTVVIWLCRFVSAARAT